jgi:hypothetical protein
MNLFGMFGGGWPIIQGSGRAIIRQGGLHVKNLWIKCGFMLLLASLPSSWALAQTPPPPSDMDFAFKPHWEFQIGLTSSGTPGDQGGGGTASDLTFTATDNFNEAGDFISFEGMGGRQKLEGGFAKYGDLSVAGGLGLGFFSPSLSLTAQTGDSALLSTTAGLNLGFQIFDDICVGLLMSGGLSSHQIPLSALDPALPDTLIEIDSRNYGGGLSLIWATSEIFSFSLTGLTTVENTYQIQNLAHTAKLSSAGQDTVLPSSSFGFDWAFIKDFSLNVTLQRSEELEPAGLSYSPTLSQTVFNDAPTTLYFSGYSVGLTYTFQ